MRSAIAIEPWTTIDQVRQRRQRQFGAVVRQYIFVQPKHWGHRVLLLRHALRRGMSFRADLLGRNGFTPAARPLLNRAGARRSFNLTRTISAPGRRKPMQRTAPPFRADHVGSLLRPPAIKEARAKRARNEITAEALRAVEDREIEKAIRKQEDIGLKLATDGEFRRSWYQFDFLKGLDGVELYQVDEGITFHGVKTKAESVRTIGRVDFSTASACRRFSLSQRAHARHAENDHSGAEHAAFPPGPAARSASRSIPISSRSSRTSPTLPARRCAPFMTPAAAICSSTTPPGR